MSLDDTSRTVALLVLLAVLALLAGCGATPAPTDGPRGEAHADPPRTSPACVDVSIGLDLRALPQFGPGHPAEAEIDRFVIGEAQTFMLQAPSGLPPRVLTQPGVGGLHAFFEGDDAAAELARCEATTSAYLATGPTLPLFDDDGAVPAADVITPCRPCQTQTP